MLQTVGLAVNERMHMIARCMDTRLLGLATRTFSGIYSIQSWRHDTGARKWAKKERRYREIILKRVYYCLLSMFYYGRRSS